ncbi:unnamed protein product [Cladocopium goreaui]|uniref:Retrovirus-related Pol polyprotein from transposon TNT 1-94 n=1 Tax=Cladocopium goreaui TaxID=2562237 RepID=A0A9P1D084_9DINO|nr:unnamed protein product [Cladocopium goreaui]
MQVQMRRKATPKEMQQGQEEMRLAQERFEKEANEGGELPLEDVQGDGKVEEVEKVKLEGAPKSLPTKERDEEGKTSPLPPRTSPAAITPAEPGSASSLAAQPRSANPQKERSESASSLAAQPRSANPQKERSESASSLAAQPRSANPQKERSEKSSAGLTAMAMTPGVVDMNKKVEEMTPLQNSAGVPNQGSATPDVMHTPLFTEEQVRDMVMLQSRTPWLYGDQPARSFFPAFRRPSFLEAEEARMSAESHEMSTMRAYMKELINQNEELKHRIHALETGFAVPEVDLSFSTPNGRGERPSAETGAAGFTEKSLEFMCLMMENMKELQRKYQEDREEGGSIRGIEVVRSGAQELPPLPAWSSNQSPLQLSDWLLLIEPVVSDLTATAETWWKTLLKEAEGWYQSHMKMSPLERLQHGHGTPPSLTQEKWQRLERRMSTMMLQAMPEQVREELVSTRRMSVFSIITHLYVIYCPGGISEKQNLLKNLEDPAEVQTLGDAPMALRKWIRWRQRATEIGAITPDPALLVRGLLRMTKKVLETNRELQFRVSLARHGLGIDTVPTLESVTQFAMHLLSECEQLSQMEKKTVPNNAKKVVKCKFYLTPEGCRKGRDCKFSHTEKTEKGDATSVGTGEGSPPKQKGAKVEEGVKTGEVKTGEETKEESETMKGLIEEANKMLRSLTSHSTSSPNSSSASNRDEDSRSEMLSRLQAQLNSLKVFKLGRIGAGLGRGLIDSGATHALRPSREEEDTHKLKEVSVTLADGKSIQLHMSPGGSMITSDQNIEPIVPMGSLIDALGCVVSWSKGALQVQHPIRGLLPVEDCGGCPQIPRKLALELISEIEDCNKGVSLNRLDIEEELGWMRRLLQAHPVLSRLPDWLQKKLVVQPGEWESLPLNRRQRRTLKTEGFALHLYSGEDSGHTLQRSMRCQGSKTRRLLEVDVKKGQAYDMLADEGIYATLLRAALSGKILAVLGGPNCRSRSVLRHRPIEGQPWAPRPVRCWEGGEFGAHWINKKEEKMIQEDDTLLWRMIFLYMISEYVRKAQLRPDPVHFALEQPASPKTYQPAAVSFWDTTEWHDLRKEFQLKEVTFNQGCLGGMATKPTTLGTTFDLCLEDHKMGPLLPAQPVESSKQLERWAPGLMNAVSEAVITQVFKGTPQLRALTYEEHVAFGHVPYRRDCPVCLQSSQQIFPHRRNKHPQTGVLALDTCGPLLPSSDVGGWKCRYFLAGAYTYMVPKGTEKMIGQPEEEGGLEEAPVLDLFAEEPEGDDQEADEQPPDGLLPRGAELPEESKKAREVTRVAMEMVLKLKIDGYHVNRIHSDRGHEFLGLDKKPEFPRFLQEVLVRRRRWKKQAFEPMVEVARYLGPAPEDNGHWIKVNDEAPRVTRCYMQKAIERPEEGTTVRRLKMEEKEEGEDEAVRLAKMRNRFTRMVEEETKAMLDDSPEMITEEIDILAKLKKMLDSQEKGEDDEVLQTKIISLLEVSKNWNDWLPAVDAEVTSLLEEKEAFEEVSGERLEELLKDAEKRGIPVEFLPSKLVCTKKPGKRGGRNKIRWVICGNFEQVKEGENTFSSGADASALRLLIVAASKFQWEAGTIDIKTAFLNATMCPEDQPSLLLVKPPMLLLEKKYMKPGTYYMPKRAVYGLRRSPKLWGDCRDDELEVMKLEVEEEEGQMTSLRLCPLASEPNLWRIEAEEREAESDTQSNFVVDAVMEKIRTIWTTSEPDQVGEKPIRFLGVEISKTFDVTKNRDVWYVNQQSYIKDLLAQDQEAPDRKIPITKDQSQLPEEEGRTPELIRSAQKATGEMLWLVTRTRLDLMYAAPQKVLQIYQQIKGYLKSTMDEGICFDAAGAETLMIEAMSDASFAPEGDVSHGAFIIMVASCPVFWRSGRQSFVTLSTAEAEMMEIVESMVAGESIGAIADELFGPLQRKSWTDSQSAQSILTTDGGSWRTRHLRLRASAARSSILQGTWFLQHVAGNQMIADIGTKPLASERIRYLKKEMNLVQVPQPKEHEKKEEKVFEEKGEGVGIQKAAAALKLLTLGAAISAAKGEHEETEKEDQENSTLELKVMMVVFALIIVLLTIVSQHLWKVGVRRLEMSWSNQAGSSSRSLPAGAAAQREEEEKENGGEGMAAVAGQLSQRPTYLPPGEGSSSPLEDSTSSSEDTPYRPLDERHIPGFDLDRVMQEIADEETNLYEEAQRNPERFQNYENSEERARAAFQVLTTRYGRVYHYQSQCRYLSSVQTGANRESAWCRICWAITAQTRGPPPPGVPLWIDHWGGDYHVDSRCPRCDPEKMFPACPGCGESAG